MEGGLSRIRTKRQVEEGTWNRRTLKAGETGPWTQRKGESSCQELGCDAPSHPPHGHCPPGPLAHNNLPLADGRSDPVVFKHARLLFGRYSVFLQYGLRDVDPSDTEYMYLQWTRRQKTTKINMAFCPGILRAPFLERD